MPSRAREFVRPLPGLGGADLLVRYEVDRGEILAYAVALRIPVADRMATIRLYDYVRPHQEHHMHRYTREATKRQSPEVRGYPTVQAGLHAAINELRTGASEVIAAWQRLSDH